MGWCQRTWTWKLPGPSCCQATLLPKKYLPSRVIYWWNGLRHVAVDLCSLVTEHKNEKNLKFSDFLLKHPLMVTETISRSELWHLRQIRCSIDSSPSISSCYHFSHCIYGTILPDVLVLPVLSRRKMVAYNLFWIYIKTLVLSWTLNTLKMCEIKMFHY